MIFTAISASLWRPPQFSYFCYIISTTESNESICIMPSDKTHHTHAHTIHLCQIKSIYCYYWKKKNTHTRNYAHMTFINVHRAKMNVELMVWPRHSENCAVSHHDQNSDILNRYTTWVSCLVFTDWAVCRNFVRFFLFLYLVLLEEMCQIEFFFNPFYFVRLMCCIFN